MRVDRAREAALDALAACRRNGAWIDGALKQVLKRDGLSGRDIHAPWKLSPETLRRAGVTLGQDYPLPLVRHDEARQRTLQRYAVTKKAIT